MPARTFRTAAGIVAFIGLLLGVSYIEQAPKYQFEREASEVGRRFPGVRLIRSIGTIDLASPVSWIRTPKTSWTYAAPDPLMRDRFYVISLVYENADPGVHLIDVDCEHRSGEWYGLDEKETALPARNMWGEPVVTPDGKTYRRLKANLDLPSVWLQAFCDTDWSTERQAAGSAMYGAPPK